MKRAHPRWKGEYRRNLHRQMTKMSSACHFLIKKGHIFSFSNKLKTYVIVKKNVLIIHCRARRYNFATRIPSIAVWILTWYILKHFYPCCRRLNETARVFTHKLFICAPWSSQALHRSRCSGLVQERTESQGGWGVLPLQEASRL